MHGCLFSVVKRRISERMLTTSCCRRRVVLLFFDSSAYGICSDGSYGASTTVDVDDRSSERSGRRSLGDMSRINSIFIKKHGEIFTIKTQHGQTWDGRGLVDSRGRRLVEKVLSEDGSSDSL